MSAGVAILLGGDAAVAGVAFVAACAIDRVLQAMGNRGVPLFYRQVCGGIVAALVAVLALHLGLVSNPSRVVTANIVMPLAGIGFVGAVQDALTGFLITAGARLTEAVLATAGIIAGVGGGLSITEAVGLGIGGFDPGAVGLGGVGQVLGGGALCAAAFGFASYAPARVLPAPALIAALALGIQRASAAHGLTQSWATAMAALCVGLLSYSVSRSLRVPPLALVVPAIVPMLPGLSIYRGLTLLNEGGPRASEGLLSLVTAAAIALALASGAILGQYLAQPIIRQARRVESRLAGPRLAGPRLAGPRLVGPTRPVRRRRAAPPGH